MLARSTELGPATGRGYHGGGGHSRAGGAQGTGALAQGCARCNNVVDQYDRPPPQLAFDCWRDREGAEKIACPIGSRE